MDRLWQLVARPQWRAVLCVAKAARRRLTVVSPFVSATATAALLEAADLEGGVTVDLLTGATAAALLAGTCDVRALAMVATTGGAGAVYRLPQLHAKVYLADETCALVTSANLTSAGLYSNYEYGALIGDPTVVRGIADDVQGYLDVATRLSPNALEQIGQMLASPQYAPLRQAPVAVANAMRAMEDILVREHVTNRTEHEVFGTAILYVLKRDGPLTTRDLHPRIQALYPEVCDDSRDRIIDGRSFGKRWKHQVRNAQQHLKLRGLIALEDDTWRLAN